MIDSNIRLQHRARLSGSGAAPGCSHSSSADAVVNTFGPRQVIIADSVKDGGGSGGKGPPGFSAEWRLAVPCAVCTFLTAPRYRRIKWVM